MSNMCLKKKVYSNTCMSVYNFTNQGLKKILKSSREGENKQINRTTQINCKERQFKKEKAHRTNSS